VRADRGHERDRLTDLDRVPNHVVRSTDEVDVVVHELGTHADPSAPPLLLVHATGLHGYVWQPLAEQLRRHRAFAPDLRGHGDTPPPSHGDFAWDGFADDVLAVVDQLELHGTDAVGHSKGGAALLLAEQRRPGTFRSLYLYEPVVIPPGDIARSSGANPLSESARRRRAEFASRAEAFDNFAGKPPLSQLDPAALHAYVDHGFEDLPDGRVRLKCAPENEAEVYLMAPQNQAFANLATVACPVTIARGGFTEFGPAAFAEHIVDALPDARLEVFAALGHFGPLEDPAALAASIEARLGR
jgi:pimeloyl-ACP methyl ester carboxylesterase